MFPVGPLRGSYGVSSVPCCPHPERATQGPPHSDHPEDPLCPRLPGFAPDHQAGVCPAGGLSIAQPKAPYFIARNSLRRNGDSALSASYFLPKSFRPVLCKVWLRTANRSHLSRALHDCTFGGDPPYWPTEQVLIDSIEGLAWLWIHRGGKLLVIDQTRSDPRRGRTYKTKDQQERLRWIRLEATVDYARMNSSPAGGPRPALSLFARRESFSPDCCTPFSGGFTHLARSPVAGRVLAARGLQGQPDAETAAPSVQQL